MNKVRLGDICIESGKYGIPAPAIDFDENMYRYLRITDISDDGYLLENDRKSLNEKDAEKYLLSKNDIVFARTGASTGRSFFYEEKFGELVYAGFLIKFKLNERLVNPKFIKYYTISQKYKKWIDNCQDGSTRGNMNANTFANMEIELPNKDEQDLAVSILSSLDDKIELNNKINRELENLAKTIYEYWLVQNAEESWERKSLYDIATFTNGLACQRFRPKGKDFYNVIKIKEMRDGFTKDTERVDVNIPENVIVLDGDILFSWSASLEVMIWTGGIGGLNQHIFKVTSDKYPKSFIYFQLTNYLNRFRAIAENRKTTMGHITVEHLKQSEIYIPPKNIIKKVDKTVSPIFEQIIKNKQENTELARQRDFLLPLLMNGQMKIKSAEQAKEISVVTEPKTTSRKGKIIMFKPTNVDYYKRSVLAAEIVWQLHKEPTLGHLKLQKLIYLCQKSTDMLIPTNFLRQAMGPYDNRLMRSIDKQFKEKKWFEYRKTDILKYQPLEKAGQHHNDFLKYFSSEKESIQFIIDTFKKTKSDTVEIVATLYACLDNILSERVIFSEALLVQRFYEWSEEKKKFNESDVKRVFSRMKEKGIVPKEYNFST